MDQIGSFGPNNVTPSPKPKPPLSTVDTTIKTTRFTDHYKAAEHFSQPNAIGTFSRQRIDAEEAEAARLAEEQAKAEAEQLQEALEEARLLKQGGRIVKVPAPATSEEKSESEEKPEAPEAVEVSKTPEAPEAVEVSKTPEAPQTENDIEIVVQPTPVLTVPELPITPTNFGRRRNS